MEGVAYPDLTVQTHHYEDPEYPFCFTGITDRNGVRYATFGYDSLGRVTFSEHAGGNYRHTFTYNADGTTTVNKPLGPIAPTATP